MRFSNTNSNGDDNNNDDGDDKPCQQYCQCN